jgi:hypothetical protein
VLRRRRLGRAAGQEDDGGARGEDAHRHGVDEGRVVEAVQWGGDAADDGWHGGGNVADDVDGRDQPCALAGRDHRDRGRGPVGAEEPGAEAEPCDGCTQEQDPRRAGLDGREGHQGPGGNSETNRPASHQQGRSGCSWDEHELPAAAPSGGHACERGRPLPQRVYFRRHLQGPVPDLPGQLGELCGVGADVQVRAGDTALACGCVRGQRAQPPVVSHQGQGGFCRTLRWRSARRRTLRVPDPASPRRGSR